MTQLTPRRNCHWCQPRRRPRHRHRSRRPRLHGLCHRSLEESGDHPLPGTIYETAAAITAAGCKGIAVRCDHGDDAQVEALFEQIITDQGRLDMLVNNAAVVTTSLPAPATSGKSRRSLPT